MKKIHQSIWVFQLPSGLEVRLVNVPQEDIDFLDGIDQLREQVQAQAAVIESLKEALQKSRSVFDSYVIIHRDKTPPDSEKAARNAFHRGVCDNALAIPTDSTQILDEVRRAERFRCAEFCEHMYADVGKHLAQMIRAME